MIRTLGGSVWVYRGIGATVALVMVGFAVLTAMVGGSFVDGVDSSSASTASAAIASVALLYDVCFLISGLIAVALYVLVRTDDALASWLAMFPLHPWQRRLAHDTPVIAGGVLTATAFLMPLSWVLWRVMLTTTSSIVVIGVLEGVVVILGAVLGLTALRLIIRFLFFLRVPPSIAEALGICLVLAGLVFVFSTCGQGVSGGHGPWNAALTALAELSMAGSGALLVGFGSLVGTAVVWYLTASIGEGRVAPRQSATHGRASGAMSPTARHLTMIDVALLMRHPTLVSTSVCTLALTLVIVLSASARSALLWPWGGTTVLSVAAVIPLVAYGVVWRHHWIYRVNSPAPVAWYWPLWAAAGGIFASVSGIMIVAFFVTPDWGVSETLDSMGQLVVAFGVAMLAGLILPVDDQQPLSSIGAAFLAFGFTVVCGFVISLLAGDMWAVSMVLGCVAAGSISPAYRRMANWRERDLVF